MLHIINDYPLDSAIFERTSFGDTVLFTENAVYALKKGQAVLENLHNYLYHLNFCVLGTDLKNRGLSCSEIPGNVLVIDESDYRDIMENNMAIKSCN